MALTDGFKLEKLKITAYSDRERNSLVSTFEAMFNPSTFSQDYEIKYGLKQGFNTSGREVDYARSDPQQLSIDLLLDGTRVDAMGLLAPLLKTVPERVDEFLDATYHMNGKSHEPNFLDVKWGDEFTFKCRLKKVTIAYSSFDRGGNPLRAKLSITLISDDTADNLMKKENKTSPDVTHTRIVRGGDTLPLLAKQIYGSADHYLFIARANGLDDFRNLVPGLELAFPPLEA